MTGDLRGHHQLWIQCRIGLCSATASDAQGNILLCPAAATSCQDPGYSHRESSVQQVAVRGPLHLIPVNRETLGLPEQAPDDMAAPAYTAGGGGDDGGSSQPQHVALVVVTWEVAVAIGITCFLVGAASTGVLWFIHNHTTRDKTVRFLHQLIFIPLDNDSFSYFPMTLFPIFQ